VVPPKLPGAIRLGNRAFPRISPPRLALADADRALTCHPCDEDSGLTTPGSKDRLLGALVAGNPDKLLPIKQSTGTNWVEALLHPFFVWQHPS
jgi:hypothetical protein